MRAAHERSPRLHELPGLTGLRALAALAVFGVHYNQIVALDWTAGGWSLHELLANGDLGVSLFFTLSGFLLSLPFWAPMETGAPEPSPGGYALRRAARILPAYYVLLAVLVVASGAWRAPGAGTDVALHALFVHNAAEFSIFSLNPPFWTLAVEVQLYCLLPMLFSWLGRLWTWQALALLAAIAAGGYLAHRALLAWPGAVVAWPGAPWLTWLRPGGAVQTYSLFGHLPHFLLGVAAGLVHLRLPGQVSRRGAGAADALIVAVAAFLLYLAGTAWLFDLALPHGRYGLPLVPTLLAAVVVAVPRARLAGRCLEAGPLRWIGRVSYGFYLWHLPCLTWLAHWLAARGLDAAAHPILFAASGLALGLGAAALSWHLVERPVLARVRAARG